MGKTLKKETFVSVAMISTVGLIITRVISVIYLMPFAAITFGNAASYVHSDVYTLFQPFYELSLAGIPFAIARLISMYNIKGQYKTSDAILKISQRILLFLGIVLMLLFVLMAKPFGALRGGENLIFSENVTTALYILSPSLILLPLMSGMRGYLQGFKTAIGVSVSQVVERLIYVVVLLVVLYMGINFFHIEIGRAMAYAFIALPVATIGTIIVIFPFYQKLRKEHHSLMLIENNEIIPSREKLYKQIVFTAIPFVITGVAATLYSTITLFTFQTTRIWMGAVPDMAKFEFTIINTWTDKLVSIPLTFSLAISVAVISFVTSAYESGDLNQTIRYIQKSYRMIIFTTFASVLIMIGLAVPLLSFFYSLKGDTMNFVSSVLWIDGFRGVSFALETIAIALLLALGKKRKALIYSCIGPLVKLVINIPFVFLFGIYGDIVATMIGLLVVVVLATRDILSVVEINSHFIFSVLFKTIACSLPAIAFSIVCNQLVWWYNPHIFESALQSFFYLFVVGLINVCIIFLLSKKSGLFSQVFSRE